MSRLASDSVSITGVPPLATREIGLPSLATYQRSPTDIKPEIFITRTSQLVVVSRTTLYSLDETITVS